MGGMSRAVCTQGHTDRRDCCNCCAWGTNNGYACCATPPTDPTARPDATWGKP